MEPVSDSPSMSRQGPWPFYLVGTREPLQVLHRGAIIPVLRMECRTASWMINGCREDTRGRETRRKIIPGSQARGWRVCPRAVRWRGPRDERHPGGAHTEDSVTQEKISPTFLPWETRLVTRRYRLPERRQNARAEAGLQFWMGSKSELSVLKRSLRPLEHRRKMRAGSNEKRTHKACTLLLFQCKKKLVPFF